MNAFRKVWFAPLTLLTAVIMVSAPAAAQQQQKPNILVIMGDDIGMWNVSAYSETSLRRQQHDVRGRIVHQKIHDTGGQH